MLEILQTHLNGFWYLNSQYSGNHNYLLLDIPEELLDQYDPFPEDPALRRHWGLGFGLLKDASGHPTAKLLILRVFAVMDSNYWRGYLLSFMVVALKLP